jgi:hypothetical protein
MATCHPYAILFCDACGNPVGGLLTRGARGAHTYLDEEGDSAPSSGLLIFPRGDDNAYEEPPLCSSCSHAIGVTALVRWAEEEEEG